MLVRSLVVVVASLVAIGCGAAPASPARVAPPSDWPSSLVIAGTGGPALYLSDAADAPAVGYASDGVRVDLAGEVSNGRIPVRIRGPLKVRAFVPVERLHAIVQRRGKLDGTPLQLGPGDRVRVLGPAGPNAMRISARPVLDGLPAATIGPFEGAYALDRLGAAEADPSLPEPPAGAPHALPASQEVTVFARPNGDALATLTASPTPRVVGVLAQRGEWARVRIGEGPYLVGYVNVPLTPAEAPASAAAPTRRATLPVPERIANEDGLPLHRVRRGARLRFDGTTIAIFGEAGYAREMRRYDNGEVDVFVAVDDDLALRGMLRVRDLEPFEGDAPAAAPTTPAQTEAPPASAPAEAGAEEP